MNRLARCGEELDIMRARFSRAARRTTKYSGGFHRHVEDAFGAGITGEEGTEHLSLGRKSGLAKRLKQRYLFYG